MPKLARRQVARIINAVERGRKSVCSIAKYWGITPQWVRELWRRSGYGRMVPAKPAAVQTSLADVVRP